MPSAGSQRFTVTASEAPDIQGHKSRKLSREGISGAASMTSSFATFPIPKDPLSSGFSYQVAGNKL